MRLLLLMLVVSAGTLFVLDSGAQAQQSAPDQAAETTASGLEMLRQGRYDEAEKYTQQAVAIRGKQFGENSAEYAMALDNLAEVYTAKGDYSRAEPLFQRGLAIVEKVYGPTHIGDAIIMQGLAALYLHRGDYERANPMMQRALEITVKWRGADDPAVAKILNNLGALNTDSGDLKLAETYYQRALQIYLKKFGPESHDVARTLANVAALYYQEGDFDRAEPLFLRSFAIDAKAVGADSPALVPTMINLAGLYRQKKDFARAQQLYIKALEIYLKTFGKDHPLIASALNGLFDNYRDKGEFGNAIPVLKREIEISDQVLDLTIATGTEEQKQLYLNTLARETDTAISTHVRMASENEQAAQLALTTILRRKGRALDAMSDQIASLKQRAKPEDRELLEQLSSLRTQLAGIELSNRGDLKPEERIAEIARLKSSTEQLEKQIGQRSARFKALNPTVTLDAVRQALPTGAALVEIMAYRPFQSGEREYAKKFGPLQYVAYVLRHDVATPRFVELGPVESIDRSITAFRLALHDPGRSDVKQLGRALDEVVMRPVRKLLGTEKRIFISPDGSLNLIPFAAMVDEDNRYLIENFTIDYLTSGRDLLRKQDTAASVTEAVIIGNPLYDLAGSRSPNAPGGNVRNLGNGTDSRRSIDFQAINYPPLPGTAIETKAIQSLIPGSRLLLQQEADESTLKHLRAPSILHIATHGFFLNEPNDAANTQERGLELGATLAGMQRENPLLRSGLILAGARQGHSGAGEDGVLTALEASSLDLWERKW